MFPHNRRWTNEFTRLQRDMDRLHNDFFAIPGPNHIMDIPGANNIMDIPETNNRELSVFGPVNRMRNLNGIQKYSPHVDVRDHEKEILVHVDLPGMDKKDVNITVSPGVLRVHGERQNKHKEKKDGHVTREERFYGCFETQVRLPDGIDGQTPVNATLENGVLEITVQKPETAKTTRQITVG